MDRSMMLSQQMARRAAAQHRRWAQQQFSRQRARAKWLASPQGQAYQAAQERAKQLSVLRKSLQRAVKKKLDCEPMVYSKNAAAMLYRSNHKDSNGDFQVVFQCNTILPGSGTPTAAMLWADRGVEWVDLDETPVQEALAHGRLFIFPAAVVFNDGEAYAMLPAFHHEKGGLLSSGKDWLWTFATAGTYRGHPFAVGRGGLGTFIDASLKHLLVARPQTFSDKTGQWVWSGRSSLEEADRLVIHAEAMFAPQEARAVKFLLPKVANAPGRAGLACTQRDDRGDPLVVYDTRLRKGEAREAKAGAMPAGKSAATAKGAAAPPYQLIEFQGRLHFVAAPNGKTADGASIFWAPANVKVGKQAVFQVAGSHRGKTVSFGLGANARDAKGSPIFVAPARAKVNGILAAAFPVDASPQAT